MTALLPGWRRLTCRCGYQREVPINTPSPPVCALCGREWQAITEAIAGSQAHRAASESNNPARATGLLAAGH